MTTAWAIVYGLAGVAVLAMLAAIAYAEWRRRDEERRRETWRRLWR